MPLVPKNPKPLKKKTKVIAQNGNDAAEDVADFETKREDRYVTNECKKYLYELENQIAIYEKQLNNNERIRQDLIVALRNKEETILELENKYREESREDLLNELEEKNKRIIELEREKANGEVETKTARIIELEDALKESVEIAKEREHVMDFEERKRKRIIEKVRVFALKPKFRTLYYVFLFLGPQIRTKNVVVTNGSGSSLSFVQTCPIKNAQFRRKIKKTAAGTQRKFKRINANEVSNTNSPRNSLQFDTKHDPVQIKVTTQNAFIRKI